MVEAINAARDKQDEGVRTSENKTYTYYMQNLNRLIEENKSLEAENNALKEENASVKERISQLDENAVKRVAAQKDEVIESLKGKLNVANEKLANIGEDYRALMSKYKYLVLQWNNFVKPEVQRKLAYFGLARNGRMKSNEIKQQPEIIEALEHVEKRKQKEVEVKREEQARQYRYQSIIEHFVNEGRDALKSFSHTERMNYNEKEATAIYYGIMATASKHNLPLDSAKNIESVTGKFLEGMTGDGCSSFRKECVTSWVKLFATKDVVYTEPIINNFLAFVDHMSCSADTYVSLDGSNGCADQLTNWDGSQKVGLGTPTKRKVQGLSR